MYACVCVCVCVCVSAPDGQCSWLNKFCCFYMPNRINAYNINNDKSHVQVVCNIKCIKFVVASYMIKKHKMC